MEKHEFVFDAVLNEEVSNDEVSILQLIQLERINWLRKKMSTVKVQYKFLACLIFLFGI